MESRREATPSTGRSPTSGRLTLPSKRRRKGSDFVSSRRIHVPQVDHLSDRRTGVVSERRTQVRWLLQERSGLLLFHPKLQLTDLVTLAELGIESKRLRQLAARLHQVAELRVDNRGV